MERSLVETPLLEDSAPSLKERRGESPTEALSNFLVKLGGLLLKYGSPTQRIESVLRATAEDHDHICEVFAVPTGLWLSLVRKGDSRPAVRLIRVYGWETDLQRLLALDEIFNAVAEREITLPAAQVRLDEIDNAPPKYPPILIILAEVVACASAAFFFGGGLRESGVGAFLGLVGGTILHFGGKSTRLQLLVDFLIGLLTGGVVWAAVMVEPDLARKPMLFAGIIVIVPGMTLTVGLGELAHKQLVSGGARLLHAAMVLVSMVLGIAVMVLLERWTGISLPPSQPGLAHPFWQQALSTLMAGAAFAVFFSVPKGSVLLSTGSCLVGWLAWLGASTYLASGAMASFMGALGLGLYANSMARLTKRPSQIFLLPGLILLVPGTLSFMGFEEFLKGDPLQGTLYLFESFLNAGALIVGLILASGALPPRKLL